MEGGRAARQKFKGMPSALCSHGFPIVHGGYPLVSSAGSPPLAGDHCVSAIVMPAS